MARNDQVSRILQIINLLQLNPQGLSAAEIHGKIKDRDFNTSDRTIYRDLQAIESSGFPLVADDENRYKLESEAKISNYLIFSQSELIALYLSKSIISKLSETVFYQDLQSVFAKITDKIGAKQRKFLDTINQDLQVDSLPKWAIGLEDELVKNIFAACAESHFLQIDYQRTSSHPIEQRTIAPYNLYLAHGSLYLICKDQKDQRIKSFAVPRIKNAVMLEESYTESKVLPSEHFCDSFGVFYTDQPEEIELKFSQQLAPYIQERRWHQSQTIKNHEDGSITLSLKVGVTPELVNWVFSFGFEVLVIKSENLLNQIKNRVSEIANLYK